MVYLASNEVQCSKSYSASAVYIAQSVQISINVENGRESEGHKNYPLMIQFAHSEGYHYFGPGIKHTYSMISNCFSSKLIPYDQRPLWWHWGGQGGKDSPNFWSNLVMASTSWSDWSGRHYSHIGRIFHNNYQNMIRTFPRLDQWDNMDEMAKCIAPTAVLSLLIG